MLGGDGSDDLSLERDQVGVAVALKQDLEGGVAVVTERTPLAELVT